MTPQIDQMRDELAELLGWTKEGPPTWRNDFWKPPGWPNCNRSVQSDHPCGSLDSLAAIWESELQGWGWLKKDSGDEGEVYWHAQSWAHEVVPILSTGNFKHDFLALTLAAVKASKGGSR